MDAVHARAAYYHSQDPAQNLAVRVSLKLVDRGSGVTAASRLGISTSAVADGAAPAPQADATGAVAVPQPPLSPVGGAGTAPLPEHWTKGFAWQEKVFGPRELLRYGVGAPTGDAASKSTSRTDEEYAARIRDGMTAADPFAAVSNSLATLHTYVDKDGYVPDHLLQERVALSSAEPSKLAKGVLGLPRRGGASSEATGAKSVELSHLFRDAPFRIMYIVATVDVDRTQFAARSPNTPMSEVVLCTIKAYKNSNLVEMQPGYSTATFENGEMVKKPYRFITDSGAAFEYLLENPTSSEADDDLLDVEREVERKKVEEQASRVARRIVGAPDAGFPLRLHAFLEIVAGAKFDNDVFFVVWEAQLPSAGWKWGNATGAIPSGVTQTARCQPRVWSWQDGPDTTGAGPSSLVRAMQPKENVAHFCYPIELDVLGHAEGLEWPNLLFSVIHRDDWGREQVEGYGYLELPRKPGSTVHLVSTWRPVGSIRQQMAEFFIGDAQHLRHASHAAIPITHTGKSLNKLGLHTQSSGEIAVRCNVVLQYPAPGDTFGVSMRRHRPSDPAVSALWSPMLDSLRPRRDLAPPLPGTGGASSSSAAAAAAAASPAVAGVVEPENVADRARLALRARRAARAAAEQQGH